MVMLAGLFGFIFLFFFIGHRTLVSFTTLFRWFALFSLVGNFVPLRWYAKPLAMDRAEWFYFNLVGVGPLIMGACLLVNFLFHGPEQKMLVQEGLEFDLHEYWRIHGELPPHLPWPDQWGVDPDKERAALATAGVGDVVFGLAQGALGYFVITSRTEAHLLPPPGEITGIQARAPAQRGTAFAGIGPCPPRCLAP